MSASAHAVGQAVDYTFTFRAENDQVAPGAFLYQSVLRVDASSRAAALVHKRHGGDLVGRPVGLFGGTLSEAEVAGLRAAIEGTRWAALPRPSAGDPLASMLFVDYAIGPRMIQRRFNARDRPMMEAIAPLMRAIEQLGHVLLAQPQRTLEVEALWSGHHFQIVLRNRGAGAVMIADPRQPAGRPGATRATVGVAFVPPNPEGWYAPPPALQPLPLVPAAGEGTPVVLAPGQALQLESAPWTPPGPGEYLAQAEWQDYAGPGVDPRSIMPALPDPREVTLDGRPYALTGAAFSSYLNITGKRR
jgi:hypothetical protein